MTTEGSTMRKTMGKNHSMPMLLVLATISLRVASAQEESCGIWLGPSPIKEAEAHGWGHSFFTGKFIPKGTVVLTSGIMDDDKKEKQYGDLFVPVYDWEALDTGAYAMMQMHDDDSQSPDIDTIAQTIPEEPPVFHQLWNGDTYDREVLESYEGMRVFMPGLANVCPCTADGFNLEQVPTMTYRDWRFNKGDSHDEAPPHPQAGSFSYLKNAMFIASRDIQPGEELVVECADNSDDFDPSEYPPVKFQPKEAGGYSICVDDKVEERIADHTPNIAGGNLGGQRGLFAKKTLEKDTILTSSPMIPVHRDEMTMDREKYAKLEEAATGTLPPKKEQLLLNYMFGHPESSLLWLPSTPLILAANHATHGQKGVQPNAKIQWHHDKYTDAQAAGKPLTRRQQFHHAELLETDSLEVVQKHGMGLMIDLVATRTIQPNEEILIDYGKVWDDAWKRHTTNWNAAVDAIKEEHREDKAERKAQRKRERAQQELNVRAGEQGNRILHKHRQKHLENSMTAIPLSSYVTAADYNDLHALDDLRTVSEQYRNPYPSNLETACFFQIDWLDDEINADEEAELVTYESWYNQKQQLDGCLLPCIVTERRDYVDLEEQNGKVKNIDDDDDDDQYAVKSGTKTRAHNELHTENGGSATRRRYTAKLLDTHDENMSVSFECHIYKRFEYYYMDIPREGITFIDKPHSTDAWIEQAFRQPIGLPEEMVPKIWRDKTRRKGMRGSKVKSSVKTNSPTPTPDEKEYQVSVKRWNELETRREKLEETEAKRMLQSPRGDL